MPHKQKIDLEKVLVSLNTVCPKCGYSISPAQIMRIDSERMRCPECGAVFAAKSEPVRKADWPHQLETRTLHGQCFHCQFRS
jgi:ribosomal protein S27AE